MLTNWYTCLHTNSQRPACSLMPVRASALYQDDGQAPEQTFDFSSETHPRNLQPLWMGNRKRPEWKTVRESRPFRCLIIKHSPWLRSSSLALFFHPVQPPTLNIKKKRNPAPLLSPPRCRCNCMTLMQASSRTGRGKHNSEGGRRKNCIRYGIAWQSIF